MKKRTFDLICIAVAAVILLIINYFGQSESFMAFSLIPILVAYLLGQFSERKFGSGIKTESKSSQFRSQNG